MQKTTQPNTKMKTNQTNQSAAVRTPLQAVIEGYIKACPSFDGRNSRRRIAAKAEAEHTALVAVAEALKSLKDLSEDPAGSTFTLREIFGTFQHGAGVPEIEGKKALAALAAVRQN